MGINVEGWDARGDRLCRAHNKPVLAFNDFTVI